MTLEEAHMMVPSLVLSLPRRRGVEHKVSVSWDLCFQLFTRIQRVTGVGHGHITVATAEFGYLEDTRS